MTVAEYIASLPADRRPLISKVRAFVRKYLPRGYTELVGYNMIMWSVPKSVLAKTYNGQPLCYAGLAAQKNFCTLYLMAAYGDKKLWASLKDGYAAAGKRFDMGKSCLHFKAWDDLETTSVAKVIAAVPMAKYVEVYQASRARTGRAATSPSPSRPARRRSESGA